MKLKHLLLVPFTVGLLMSCNSGGSNVTPDPEPKEKEGISDEEEPATEDAAE